VQQPAPNGTARVYVGIDRVDDLGSFRQPEGTVTVGGFAMITGWCIDGVSHEPVEFSVAIGEGEAVPAIIGFIRDDVAERFSTPARRSGFVAAVPVDVPLGKHALRIALLDERAIEFTQAASVDVVPPRDPFEVLHERNAGWLFNVEGVFVDESSTLAARDGEAWIVPPGSTGRIRLWALDLEARRAPRSVVARAGATTFDSLGCVESPGIADVTGIEGAEKCGFVIPVAAPCVESEAFRLFALGADTATYGELGTVRVRAPDPLRLNSVPRRGRARGGIDRVEVDGVTVPVDGAIHVPRGASVAVAGWAVDRAVPGPASLVQLDVPGMGRFDAEYGLRRPDVAERLDFRISDCGFSVTLQAGQLRPGAHRGTLRVLSARRDSYTELGDVHFVVR
jgi:hypothetical protein